MRLRQEIAAHFTVGDYVPRRWLRERGYKTCFPWVKKAIDAMVRRGIIVRQPYGTQILIRKPIPTKQRIDSI